MAIDHLPPTAVETVPAVAPQPVVSPYVAADIAPEKTPLARSDSRKVRAAKATGRGLGSSARWVVTGVANSAQEWVGAYHDDHLHIIRLAKEELRVAGNRRDAVAAKAAVKEHKKEHRLNRLQHLGKTSLGTLVTGGTLAVGGIVVGGWLDLLLAAAGVIGTAWHGQRGTVTAIAAAPEMAAIEGGIAIGDGTISASAPALMEALDAIKVPGGSTVVSSTPGSDDTSITIVNLPANFTVTSLRKQAEELAGALGRDTTMVDIRKGAHANQAVIWISSRDPFEAPRPSPLMERHVPLDTWTDGAPVAWGKRGNIIALPITNANFLIAGMTRSGKGVGAANLVAAAALDPRINLRIVAGKNNGEWDPAAKAGVAATYFKPNPHRLNALLEALWADKDRREQILGKAGKSKMTPATIMELGGIELLVIDEVATYTRPGNELRDENLKLLTDISAVAAAAGILMVLITQYPEVDVIPQALAMNCGSRWAMRVDNAGQSNAILGGGASSSGRDASKFDPPRPGLGWLVNPFAGVTDLARSFDLDEDERGEVSALMAEAAKLRELTGRLPGQWDDPIERALAERTGLSSAAGGPHHNGVPGRVLHLLDPQETAAYEALADAVEVMAKLGRDAQIGEMAAELEMPAERLGELLRKAGAGRTEKIWVPDGDGGKTRVNGYRRDQLKALLDSAAVA